MKRYNFVKFTGQHKPNTLTGSLRKLVQLQPSILLSIFNLTGRYGYVATARLQRMRMDDIAKKLKVSRQRVHQIEKKIISLLS